MAGFPALDQAGSPATRNAHLWSYPQFVPFPSLKVSYSFSVYSLNAYYYIERCWRADFWSLSAQPLGVHISTSESLDCFLADDLRDDLKADGVKVGASLAASLDADHASLLQFTDVLRHTRAAHANGFAERLLAGEALIIVPGIAQEHRVNDLRPERKLRVFQYKIRHLRKAAPGYRIEGSVELDVLLFDDVAG